LLTYPSLSTSPFHSTYSSPLPCLFLLFVCLKLQRKFERVIRTSLLWVFVSKYRIELNPGHVGFGDIGDMASRTFGHRRFRGGLRIRQWVMSKSEETPAVGLSELLTVFHCYVDAVVLTVEIPASGWFGTRAV